MKIHSIDEASSILGEYIPQVASYTGDGMSLNRMWPLLQAAGNPRQKLKAIHIAGTSGKTSTSYYIAAILQATGKKVGLTVSPHVDSITERVQINGKPISEELFCSELGEFLDLISDVSEKPSYFELLVVFVLWFFAKSKVDYAVIETGMGGLLDGTNVLQSHDKICVITDIGFDHMHILGNTLTEIAAQKAGIIHTKNEVFMYDQAEEITQQIKLRVKEKSAELHFVNFDEHNFDTDTLAKLPEFQKRNYLLAESVCKFISSRDAFILNSFNAKDVAIPGRMETRKLVDGSILIMDGAHNEQKMKTFVYSFTAEYPNQKADILLALKQGKEYEAVVTAIAPIVESVILTSFDTAQDMPAKSQDTALIAAYCRERNIKVKIFENSTEALQQLLAQNSRLKIITGSFYLLSKVRHSLLDKTVLL